MSYFVAIFAVIAENLSIVRRCSNQEGELNIPSLHFTVVPLAD